jgi:hypothetical protein
MRVQIHLRAEKLKNQAARVGCGGKLLRGKRSSPYCKVVCLSSSSIRDNNDVIVGGINSTEVQYSNLDPHFSTSIIVNHDESSRGWTHLRVTIYDCRKSRICDDNDHNNDNDNGDDPRDSDTDPMMGEVDIEIGDIFRSKGQEKEIKMNEGRGTIFVHATKSMQGQSPAGMLECQIRGLDIKNIESGLLGLGAIDPYYIISKKHHDFKTGLSRWYVIYKSEHVHNIINPYWKPFRMDLERFCNNDLNKELKIAIYDQEDFGSDRWLGEVETNLVEMQLCVAKRGNADREAALRVFSVEEDGKEDLRALLVILQADVSCLT